MKIEKRWTHKTKCERERERESLGLHSFFSSEIEAHPRHSLVSAFSEERRQRKTSKCRVQCSLREAHAWHLFVGYGCFTFSLSSADPASFRRKREGERPQRGRTCYKLAARAGRRSRERKRGEREAGRVKEKWGFDWWLGAEMAFCPIFCCGRGLDR